MTTTMGDLPLGEVFSQHLRDFWNPVAPHHLYSSPDGSVLAVVCDDGSVRVIDARTGDEYGRCIGARSRVGTTIVDAPLTATCAAWSPDGQRLAVGYVDGSVRVWDRDCHNELLCWAWHTECVTYLIWSPDGGTLASVGDDAVLVVWEAATGDERFFYQGIDEREPSSEWFPDPTQCTFAPDGGHLAVSCSDGVVRVLTTETGEEVARLRCEDTPEAICWSPIGACILVLVGKQGAVVWNPFQPHYQTLLGELSWRLAAWSPDGMYVALGSPEGVALLRWEDLVEGRPPQGCAYHGQGVSDLSWLSGETLAVACAQGVKLVPVK